MIKYITEELKTKLYKQYKVYKGLDKVEKDSVVEYYNSYMNKKTTNNRDIEMHFTDKVIVRYFNPYANNSWLITAGVPISGTDDWMLYGLINNEWGKCMLSEIMGLRDKAFNLVIERDLMLPPSKYTVRELMGYKGLIVK